MLKRKKRADQLNKEILQHIYTLIGSKNTTFGSQLEGAGKKLLGPKFKGVFPSDKIPKLNDLSKYAILNLDRSGEPGSHWIAIAKDDDDLFVYDSFGREHTKIIPNIRFSGNGKIIDTDDDAEQGVLETSCGQRCLAFLYIFEHYGRDVAKMI